MQSEQVLSDPSPARSGFDQAAQHRHRSQQDRRQGARNATDSVSDSRNLQSFTEHMREHQNVSTSVTDPWQCRTDGAFVRIF